MSLKIATLVASAALVAATAAFVPLTISAQEAAGKPAIKEKPMPYTASTDGKTMFTEYCASCHGPSGKGDGRAAPALKTTPADLTLLAKNNGGTFPAQKVSQILRFGVDVPAHGSTEMPTWGPGLRAISGGSDAVVTMRITNLADYIRTLQAK
jgi:mono/diheme cytochrome c family protein